MAERRQYRSMRHLALDRVDFLSIFDRFDEGIIIVDHGGRIVYYNDTMSRIDDLKPDVTVGRRITEIYGLTNETSMIMRCLNAAEPIVNRTFFYRTRMGKVANTIHSVFPLIRDEKLIGAICFVKDYTPLEASIVSITPSSERTKYNSGPGFTFDDIVGRDPELLRCVNTARMAANSPSPVMLCGETGTGKELFAQAIHSFSSRRKKRYIPVNCAAIPESLLEGILFGTNRGAFTGALDRAGLFESASGGTLFLDEINSMPVGLQAKILRVLQEKKVRRLGSRNEVDTDIKTISSVNREPHLDIEDNVLRMEATRTSVFNPVCYHITNFTLSCALAGWLGGSYAHYYGILTPDMMYTAKTVEVLAVAYIGGRGSLWGPAAVAFPFVLAMELVRSGLSNLPGLNQIIYGLMLMLVMIYYPGGFGQLYNTLLRRKINENVTTTTTED